MINYGLKLWSNNGSLFKESYLLYHRKNIDFIESYHNANFELDFERIKILKGIPTFIHNASDCGFHEFQINPEQLKVWEKTKKLADYFKSPYIVVHSGKASRLNNFRENLKKIDDPRIIIENMAELDIYGKNTFGYNLEELKKIKEIKNICFDLEKAVKSACYQKIDYKEFISQCLQKLKPFYFHISGGDVNNLRDEHLNLQEANFDIKWIKNNLKDISMKKDIFLVFEVPKNKNNLYNDVKNVNYFKKI